MRAWAVAVSMSVALVACGRNVPTGSRCAAGVATCAGTSAAPSAAGATSAGEPDAGSTSTGEPDAGPTSEPDAGPTPSTVDAGSPGECPDGGCGTPGAELCVENPSIEGATPFITNPAGWTYCLASAALNPAFARIAPSEGAAYLGLLAYKPDATLEGAQATLCAPLAAGKPVSFAVDLTLSTAFGPFGPAQIEVWGAIAACGAQERLWTSPLLTEFDAWRSYCVAFTPAEDYAYLVFVATTAPDAVTGAYVLLDNIRSASASACP